MTADFFLRSLTAKPKGQAVDALKFLYQSAYGAGHLLAPEAECAARIARETESLAPDDEPPLEPLGNGLCRLRLRHPAVRALPPVRIARMMAAAVGNTAGDVWFRHGAALVEALATAGVTAAMDEAHLPFTAGHWLACLQSWRAQGGGPPSHSEAYRAAYAPAYRVTARRLAEALPLLTAVEQSLTLHGRATLVLDGDCAAGKTSLAALLAPLYPATVIHMDDFFLPPALRTVERLAQPGGNVHAERFADEVLTPLLTGGAFTYGAYDCHSGQTRPVTVRPQPVVLIEGSYALHPAFDAAYRQLGAVRALLTVDAAEQLRRIRLRNGPAMLARFQEEWIPLEFQYFQAYHKPREDTLRLTSLRRPEDEPPGEESKP